MKSIYLTFLFVVCCMPLLSAQSETAQLAQEFTALFKKKDYPNAIKTGEKWKSSMYQTGIAKADSARVARRIMDLASCYKSTLQFRNSETVLQEALVIMPSDSVDYDAIKSGLGSVKTSLGKYQEADSILQDALLSFKKHRMDKGRAYNGCIQNLADLRFNQGLVQESYALYQEALAHCNTNKLGEGPLLARIYSGLYQISDAQGNYSQAEKWLEKSFHIISQFYPHDGEVVLGRQRQYAILLMKKGELQRAEPFLNKLIKLIEKKRGANTLEYARALCVMTCIDQQLGKIDEALHLTTLQDPIFTKNLGGAHFETIENKTNRITLLLDSGKKNEAKIVAQAILDTLQAGGKYIELRMATFYNLLAQCTENADSSLALREKAFNIVQTSSGQADGGENADPGLFLAADYLKLGRLEDAQRILALFDDFEAKAGSKNSQYLKLLFHRAQLHLLQGNTSLALQEYTRLVNTRRELISSDLLLLNDYQRLNRFNQLRSMNNWMLTQCRNKDIRQAGFISLALDFQLFTKSLLLFTAQKIRENIQADTTLAPIFSAWKDTRERLAWCYTQPKTNLEKQNINIEALESRADSLETVISRSSSALASENLRKPFVWTDVRDQLRPGEAALEIARFQEFYLDPSDSLQYAVFIIRPEMRERPAVIFIEDAERLDQMMLEKYLAECAVPGGKGQTGQLYQAFWKNLEPYLKDISRLYVAADGAFFKINIGAIQLPDGQYVADRYDVRNVFSLKDIDTKNDAQGTENLAGKTAFLAGNPAFLLKKDGDTAAATLRAVSETPDSLTAFGPFESILRNADDVRGINLSSLPGSQQEVQELDALLRKKGWRTTLVTGLTANEDTLKALKNPGILHLATHGYFLSNVRSGAAGLSRPLLESNPMLRSMVFFAGAQNTLNHQPVGKEDGILTAYEAQNLQLEGTELVVLSACQTAQGKIQNGEGVYGLQRALRIAGAQAVLLSLWDVDDKVGREFMTIFYEKWLGGTGKADAFRAAQLAVKKKHPKPFYWAGFVLIGG